ncbi:MAG: O-antigen ligase family protein [Patescibacteria group bacterium]|nr:O-antigen ligase family protein [Patescibacteria group bacterium]
MKFSRWFVYLLLFLLPVQLGKHFWPEWTMIFGLKIDYLSPTIYLTDILILGILASWFFSQFFPASFFLFLKKQGKIFLLLIFLLANCFFAQNQPAAFYKLIKVTEFVLLFLFLVKNKISLSDFRYPIFGAVIYSSLIAVFQFLNQGSLGGLFWFLGERNFNAGTPGIAQTVINGRLFLRPYATFSHPNVLAGFLTLDLLLVIFLRPKHWRFGLALGSVALFLTFSHTAWFGFFLGLLGFYFWPRKKPNPKYLLLGLMVFLTVGILGFRFIPIPEESIAQRQELNTTSLKMIKASPFLGVGLANFFNRLPEFYQNHGLVRFLQPAHNLYLLIGAETGFMGLVFFLVLIVLTYQKGLRTNSFLLVPFSVMLILGLFDHYFYTLQQGQILMVLIFSFIWSGQERSVKINP